MPSSGYTVAADAEAFERTCLFHTKQSYKGTEKCPMCKNKYFKANSAGAIVVPVSVRIPGCAHTLCKTCMRKFDKCPICSTPWYEDWEVTERHQRNFTLPPGVETNMSAEDFYLGSTDRKSKHDSADRHGKGGRLQKWIGSMGGRSTN